MKPTLFGLIRKTARFARVLHRALRGFLRGVTEISERRFVIGSPAASFRGRRRAATGSASPYGKRTRSNLNPIMVAG